MKRILSKAEAKEKIEQFFKKNDVTSEEMKKIRRLALKYRISLKPYKKQFCKSCLSPLKGKIRISKTHKTVECVNCGYRNKYKFKPS